MGLLYQIDDSVQPIASKGVKSGFVGLYQIDDSVQPIAYYIIMALPVSWYLKFPLVSPFTDLTD